MAQRVARRSPVSGNKKGKKSSGGAAKVATAAASILTDTTARKRGARTTTLENQLEAKAARADRADFSGPSLGEMSREQRHKRLYGE